MYSTGAWCNRLELIRQATHAGPTSVGFIQDGGDLEGGWEDGVDYGHE